MYIYTISLYVYKFFLKGIDISRADVAQMTEHVASVIWVSPPPF